MIHWKYFLYRIGIIIINNNCALNAHQSQYRLLILVTLFICGITHPLPLPCIVRQLLYKLLIYSIKFTPPSLSPWMRIHLLLWIASAVLHSLPIQNVTVVMFFIYQNTTPSHPPHIIQIESASKLVCYFWVTSGLFLSVWWIIAFKSLHCTILPPLLSSPPFFFTVLIEYRTPFLWCR